MIDTYFRMPRAEIVCVCVCVCVCMHTQEQEKCPKEQWLLLQEGQV